MTEEKSFLFPGQTIEIYVNQGYRQAIVLAAIGNKRLVEYYMPNGTTALSFLETTNLTKRVAVSYWALSVKWLRAINEGTGFWIGNPQQNKGHQVPSPSELLEKKLQENDIHV